MCFLPPWYLKIDSNQTININMLYENLAIRISDFLLHLRAATGSDTISYKINVGKVHVFKKVNEDSPSLTLICLIYRNCPGKHISSN